MTILKPFLKIIRNFSKKLKDSHNLSRFILHLEYAVLTTQLQVHTTFYGRKCCMNPRIHPRHILHLTYEMLLHLIIDMQYGLPFQPMKHKSINLVKQCYETYLCKYKQGERKKTIITPLGPYYMQYGRPSKFIQHSIIKKCFLLSLKHSLCV